MRARLAPLAVVAAIAASAASGAPAAVKDKVSCGDRITTDTKLQSDVVDCPSNGLLIRGDDLTLDLNGHTIEGNGKLVADCPEGEPCDIGIDAFRARGVTIKNGSLRRFGYGVGVFEARDVRVRNVSSSHNHFNGILAVDTRRVEVVRSSATRNGLTTDFPGLAVIDSRGMLIKRNRLNRNADLGLFAINVDRSLIERNVMARNPEAGIILEGDGNEITRNRIVGNGDGIAFDGDGNALTRNRVLDSHGCPNGCGFGISFETGRHTLIAHNTVRGAARDGILVGIRFGNHARHTSVVGNHVSGAGRDGLRVASKGTGTLLKRNHIRRSGDDGFDVRRASTTLTENRANANRDLGVDAVKGVTDGGGNRAQRNGGPHQCRNLFCL